MLNTKWVEWVVSHIDAITALILAIIFTVMGFAGKLTADQLSNVALAILALFAFMLLRESTAREALKENISAFQRQIIDLTKNQIEPIPPNQIQQDFKQAFDNTRHWYYKGGTGTFLRAVTIKSLGEKSKTANADITLRIEILDPTNDKLCKTYGNYRRSVRSTSEVNLGNWSAEHVREELYATILAACIFQDDYPLLKMELGLSNTMTLFRYDVSSECAIITQENRTAPALKAEKNTHYYDSFVSEVRLSFQQSKKLPLESVKGLWVAQPSSITVLEVFRKLEIYDLPFFTEERRALIIEKATKAINPYAP